MGNSFTTFHDDSTKASKFSAGMVRRAKKRTVRNLGAREWVVLGNSSLSDAYPEYFVTLPDGAQHYYCSCREHAWGETRRLCSHIVGVILYRAGEHPDSPKDGEISPKDDEVSGTEPLPEPVSDVRVEIGSVAEPAADVPEVTGSPQTLALPDDPPPVDSWLFDPPLPPKFERIYENQWRAVREIVDAYDEGYKVVFLSAPTGCGKTFIVELVNRFVGRGQPATYTCISKSLQDQVLRDFDYAKVLKGRSNYPVLDGDLDPTLTADDCEMTLAKLPVFGCGGCPPGRSTDDEVRHCPYCHPVARCPYRRAKEEAVDAPLAVLNLAYLLGEANSPRSKFTGRRFTIIDEADALEDWLLSYAEVSIGPRVRSEVGCRTMPKKTVEDDWVRWIRDDFMPAVDAKIREYKSQASLFADLGLKEKRRVRALSKLYDECEWLVKPRETSDGEVGTMLGSGWVFTGYEGRDYHGATLTFKPVVMGEWARDLMWAHSNRWLLMSATFVSVDQIAADLGLRDEEWTLVSMDSTFPAESRPNFYVGAANMTNKTKEEAWPDAADALARIIDDNAGVRILVHTVSYGLTQFLATELRHTGRVVTYSRSTERDQALAQFLNMEDGVLLAPSFERGIDLPGEDCEVIVIAKVPWPYLGDKRVSKRVYDKQYKNGQTWYSIQTIRSIVQMTGRGMRSEDDHCDTYILDQQFKRLFVRNKRLFPPWWREAVVMNNSHPDYQPMISARDERIRKRAATLPELPATLPDPF